MTPTELVLATRNPHKVGEIAALLKDLPVRLLTAADFPDIPEIAETGLTFRDNALLKACTLARLTGRVALADDSGLEVDALGGEPGVRSNRLLGKDATPEERNRYILERLRDIPDEKRTARFVAVIAIATPEGETFLCEGVCEGRIARAPGGKGGFGYDPIFELPERECTMAELTPKEKNAMSHRGKALKAARPLLEKIFGPEPARNPSEGSQGPGNSRSPLSRQTSRISWPAVSNRGDPGSESPDKEGR